MQKVNFPSTTLETSSKYSAIYVYVQSRSFIDLFAYEDQGSGVAISSHEGRFEEQGLMETATWQARCYGAHIGARPSESL